MVSAHGHEGSSRGGEGGSGSDVEMRVRRLKQDLIDNINMIKTMYESETRLRADLDTAILRADKLQAVNGDLHNENARLRNQLSSLMGNGLHHERVKEAANVVETVTIPGYGVARARALEDEIGGVGCGRDGRAIFLSNNVDGISMDQNSNDTTANSSGGFFNLVSEDPPAQPRNNTW